MLKKLVVVYDAGAASFEAVKKEIIEPARKLTGMLVGKFVWQPVGFGENARRLAQFLHDGDLVVVAGGDSLASMAANAILLSRRDVAMAVIGYGLTNDISGLTRVKRPVLYGDEYVGGIEEILRKAEEGRTVEIFPLQLKVNDKIWRYAVAHASVGMLAASLQSLDGANKKHLVGARMRLFGWRLLHGREKWLPEATLKQLPVEIKGANEADSGVSLSASKDLPAREVLPAGRAVSGGVTASGGEASLDGEVSSGEVSSGSVTASGDEVVDGKQALLEVGKKTMALMAESAVKKDEVALPIKEKEAIEPAEVVKKTEIIEEALPVVAEPAVYEIMILGELGGKDLRISRGVAGIMERIRLLRQKLYDKRHGRVVACAAETVDKSVEIDAGKLIGSRVTDLIVVNGLTMGKKWHGGRFYKKPEGFLMKTASLGGVLKELRLSLVSRIWRIPGTKVKGKVELKFLEPQNVYVQTDNAWEELTGVETIEIAKAGRSIKMVK